MPIEKRGMIVHSTERKSSSENLIPPTMKAILVERPGPPEVLRYVDRPTPVPMEGQVLIRAHTIGVSMPEILVRRGEYGWMPTLPAIPGIEMIGVIVSLGEGVKSLRVGQPVFVSSRELPERGGCYAEYLAANADALYLLPEGADLEGAAALSNYQVAWHLLNSAPGGMPYGSVLVTGAAGGIGTALVQLGKLAGKRIIGLVDTDEKAAFAISLGADGAINSSRESVTDRTRDLTGGVGFDLILDSIGGAGFVAHFERLAPFGLLVSYGKLDGPPVGDVLGAMGRRMGDSLGLRMFSMHLFDHDRQRRRTATEVLLQLLAGGKIRPAISLRLPLAEAARAHALIESGQVLGKVVLKP
jgi:NADPH2:quinone reductase